MAYRFVDEEIEPEQEEIQQPQKRIPEPSQPTQKPKLFPHFQIEEQNRQKTPQKRFKFVEEEPENIPEGEPEPLDYVKEFGKQAAQGFGIGALGTYGDILELFQPTEMLPGEKEKYGREFRSLEKLEKGEVPSVGELMELSDEDIIPRYSKLPSPPSSRDIEQTGSKLGLVSEPKTAAGRYGRRIGKLGGSGVSLGAGALASPIVAGSVGQTLEEAGAPGWLQAAGEIIAGIKFAPNKTKVPVSSRNKEVEKVISDLRNVGYSDSDLALAKSALEEKGIIGTFASLTPRAENAIMKSLKNNEELFRDQIKKGLPGYAEGGLPYLEKQASNVYQTMENLASTVHISNKEPVKNAIQEAISYLEKYPILKEQKDFIDFMKDGLSKIDKADTAEFFTGFYRNLGKAGNWGDPKQKEHILGLVQRGIKDTFAKSGKDAEKFGKYFELTNESWKHWLKARDLMQTIEKAQNVDGINFKKLSYLLNDPRNNELAKKVLGPEQLRNIKTISEGSQAIETLLKKIPTSDKNIQYLKAISSVVPMFYGNYKPLVTVAGYEIAKRLSTETLINPKFQNIAKKMVTAVKNNAIQQAAIHAENLLDMVNAQEEKIEEKFQ